jgi:predicted NBD/HSP70 family sugar kinase
VADWKDVPLGARLGEWAGVPATLIGYAPSLALAEQSRRAGAEPRNLVTVEVAENIAMGAIVNGSLLEGASGNAGELGHVPLDPAGSVCYCGARGCLESVATCTAVLDQVRAREGAPGDYAEVVRRAREGDAYRSRVLGHAARALGRGLGAALSLFNPEVLVLNGRFFDAGDLVLSPLRTAVRESAIPSCLKPLVIEQSALGTDAAALGAGLAAVRDAVQRL